MRLRINFYEELSQIEEYARNTSVREGLSGFSDTVNGAFADLLSDENLSEENRTALTTLKEGFDADLGEILAGEANSQDRLAAAADVTRKFLEELAKLFTPSEALTDEIEAPLETEESTDLPTDNEPSKLSTFQSLIEASLTEMQSRLDATTVLPPLSQPSEHGVAYQKFLNQYRELQGGTQEAPNQIQVNA